MRCIFGLSCVIQYSHGMLEVRTLVTILSLLMLPLFWYLNACRGFHLEKGSHQKQTLIGRPGEWALHTNIQIVNLSPSFWVSIFSDPILQSNQHIKWSKRTKSNLNSSTSLRCWKSPPSLHQMLHRVLAQTHPHLEQPKKKWIKITRNQSKKKRLGAKSSNWMRWKLPIFGR